MNYSIGFIDEERCVLEEEYLEDSYCCYCRCCGCYAVFCYLRGVLNYGDICLNSMYLFYVSFPIYQPHIYKPISIQNTSHKLSKINILNKRPPFLPKLLTNPNPTILHPLLPILNPLLKQLPPKLHLLITIHQNRTTSRIIKFITGTWDINF